MAAGLFRRNGVHRTMTHPLDLATTLDNAGGDIRNGRVSEDYWAFVGPFGGASAAIFQRAVLDHPQRVGDPLALTVNYCAPLAKGEYEVHAKPARTNRSTQHWTLELRQGGETILTGTAVTAERRDSFSHAPAVRPQVPSPGDLAPYRMGQGGPSWVDRYEFRFAEGAPRFGAPADGTSHSALSHLWLRDAPARPLDHASLAGLSDAFFARIFHVQGQMVPFGTVSLTTYFLGTADEIARQGDRHLLGIADAKRFHRNYFDQSIELWSEDGALLATGVQIAYFKL